MSRIRRRNVQLGYRCRQSLLKKRSNFTTKSQTFALHVEECKQWKIALGRTIRNNRLFCSTYLATSTQHTEDVFIFILLKTWRWLVNALWSRSWHNLEDTCMTLYSSEASCRSGSNLSTSYPGSLTAFSSGITSRRSHFHPQAPVARKVDNAIHRINRYPADSVVCFVNTYPLDSDLSGG